MRKRACDGRSRLRTRRGPNRRSAVSQGSVPLDVRLTGRPDQPERAPRRDRHSCTLTSVENLDSKQVYTDPWLSVRQDTVRRSDGSSGVYSVVDTADCSLVIPVDGDRVHLIEQYRYPVDGRRWEFPSGSTDHVLDTDCEGGGVTRTNGKRRGSALPR